jgi:AcrR family transcriptional regulator
MPAPHGKPVRESTELRADAFSNVARIIAAARRVFASGDGTGSLSQIAKDAGVGVATLYRHFRSREALALAVYDRMFTEEVQPLIEHFATADTPRSALLDIAERINDIAAREPGLVQSLGSLTEATRVLVERSAHTLVPMLERAQEAGTIRPDIEAADIPNLIALFTAGLGVFETDRTAQRRYFSLLLDALNPAHATPLPAAPRPPAG